MSAQINLTANIGSFATSTVSKVSAPYQTTGNGNTAKVIRRLIGEPQQSYVMQEAPRHYIRSVREAGLRGTYRQGLELSESRDELNRRHIQSMQGLLSDLRGASPADDGGFIMVHLNNLLNEHSKYLGSESYEKLSWLAQERPAAEDSVPEESATVEQAFAEESESAMRVARADSAGTTEKVASAQKPEQEVETKQADTPPSIAQQPVTQSDVVASSGLK